MSYSIDNPKPFDFLKVVEWETDNDYQKANYEFSYPLTCVVRNSVTIDYADNSTYQLSFDVFNDGSAGFKALHERSRIIAGDQIFVIQSYTKKVAGNATASVTAVQLVNADFQRVNQPRMFRYKSKDSKDSNDKANISYVTLDELLQWFFRDIDSLGFKYRIHGWFPRRPIKNIGHWSGKQLLTQITKAWPGTVVIGWGHIIHFYGYQQERDPQGNLQNVRDIDTGLRFDAMRDTRNVEIKRDTSSMCNAIEVKSATYSINNDDDDDDDEEVNDESDEFVFQSKPYFPNFVATSPKSIQKYGLYTAQDVLDDGFTNKQAALAAAREHMVLDPVITVTASVDHPGKTEDQPIPGHKYTLGIEQENEIHHVILRCFKWYPFDPTRGVQLTLNNVDPGIIDHLRETIIHDAELSPTLTKFQALTDDSTEDEDGDFDDSDIDVDRGDDDTTPDTVSDTEAEADSDDDLDDDASLVTDDQGNDDGDTSIPDDSTDDQNTRPDDNGDGTSDKKGKPNTKPQTKPGFKAYLPMGDKGTNAEISRFGNITLFRGLKRWTLRVAPRRLIKKLHNGTFSQTDHEDKAWKHSFMLDFDHYPGGWYGDADHPLKRDFYQPTDLYFGGNVQTVTGMYGTTAPYFTFITDLKDSDYNDDGTLKHHADDDGHYHDYKNHRGHLAEIYAGTIHAHIANSSLLSKKKQVKNLDKAKALNTILNTDIGTYRYKGERDGETYASLIIDDVDKSKKWKTPRAFITRDGKHRKDDVTIGYLVKSVQALQDEINDLKDENKKLKKQLKSKD